MVTAVAQRLSLQGRDGWNRLGQSATLDPEVWVSERRTKVDCQGLHRVDGKWEAPIGHLKDINERLADCAG